MADQQRRMSGQARRELILVAARDVFTHSGLAGSRVRDIADQAGVNDAMLYRHFDSKEQLFEEAVAQPIEAAVTRIVERPFPPLPPEAGTDVMRARSVQFFRDLLLAMHDVGPLLGVVLFADRETGKHYYAQFLEPAFARLVDLTAETIGAWAHRPFDAGLVQRVVFGMCWMLCVDELLGTGTARDVDELAEELVDILFDGIADARR